LIGLGDETGGGHTFILLRLFHDDYTKTTHIYYKNIVFSGAIL